MEVRPSKVRSPKLFPELLRHHLGDRRGQRLAGQAGSIPGKQLFRQRDVQPLVVLVGRDGWSAA